MKQLRSSWMAVALLCVAACADLVGDDGAHRACPRKAMETRSARPGEPSRHATPPAMMSPAPAIRTRATTAAPAAPAAPAAHDPSFDPGCDPEHAEPHEQFWDGTGRTEAVRGA
ncbi:MAG TPA: hypothetical protein VFD36_07445 [Kofleriaceae bacterium]|nr:hypothetical protein [Kofleriaceae bacterium]